MKFSLKKIMFLCAFLGSIQVAITQIVICPIIPQPQKSQKQNTIFKINATTKIVCDDEFQLQAQYLQNELLRYKNIAAPIKNSVTGIGFIVLKKNKKIVNDSESYSIKMNGEKVEILASSSVGIFNGITSFIQLVRLSDTKNFDTQVDCWNIEDAPQYSWRGLMLDESRHFFGKNKVKMILDWMATYKMNHFHWHLTDGSGWRIEIKQYPKLALVGGIGNYTDPCSPAMYYTQDDIKEIVQYAAERFIVVIPEIEMPGHATAANRAYPEYSGGGSAKYPDFTYNPGKEAVYSCLTNILKEVDVLFPSQMIHIGGDEVHYGNEKWATDSLVRTLMEKEKLPDLKSVETYFFKRMADSVTNMGNKVLAWDEVADSDLSPSNTIVFYWRDDKPEQLQKALDKGFSVVLSPRHPMYFDYVQDTTLVYGPSPKSLKNNTVEDVYNFTKNSIPVVYSASSKVLGIQANLWTESVVTEQQLDFMLFPRLAALSEAAWSNLPKDFELFKVRLKKHFDLYKAESVYYFDVFDKKNTAEPVP